MTLEGAQFICLDEAGNRGTIVKAKGRKFTVGYYTSCDVAIDDERAKGVHCTIECDAFGRITIANSSLEHPIAINGENVTNKRILFNKTTIKILDKSYLWEFATKNAKEFEDVQSGDVSTPQKQIGIPQQSAFSCPDVKHTQKTEPRFTVHNFAYCIQSDEDGNTSRESNENDTSNTAAEKEDPDVSVKSETKEGEAEERCLRHVTPEPTECKEEQSVETPKMNLINSTNNKENSSSTHKKNRLQLTLCHQSDVVITSFSPRETGVKTEKSFTAILKPKVLVTRAPNTPKSVYSTPKSVLGDDDDDDADASSRNIINFHTPSTSRKGSVATNTASKCLKNSSMHLVDFTTPNKLAPASPYLMSALKASAKKLPMTASAAKGSKDKVTVEEQLGISDLPLTPVVSDDSKTYSETPNSIQSVISVDSTDTSSVIELLSDESTPGTNANIVLKTPGKCATGKIQATTPKRTPQSLMKRAILTSTKKQATTPQRPECGPVTPRREPINRIPLRCSIGSLKSPVTPNPTGRDAQLSRRLSMSTPSRKTMAAPRSESTPLTTTNASTTTPSSTRRSSLVPMSASRAQTSTPYGASNRKHAACKTSPLKRVRKSIGGIPLSSHISKVRRSIISATPSKYTSIKEKSPQQAMSDRLVLRARKSVCLTPIVARAISMVEAAKTPTAGGILKKQTQSARKSLAARPVLFADRQKRPDDNEAAELSRTFVVDSDEDDSKEVDKEKATLKEEMDESTPKDATFSPEKGYKLNATFSPEKNPNTDDVLKSLEIPLDVEEVAQNEDNKGEPSEHDSRENNFTKHGSQETETSSNKTENAADGPKPSASEESFAEIIDVTSQAELTAINKTSSEIVAQIEEIDENGSDVAIVSDLSTNPVECEAGFGEESLIEKSESCGNSTTIEPQTLNGENISSITKVTKDNDTIEVIEADSPLREEEPSISGDKNETLDVLGKTTTEPIEKEISFVYKPICEDITLESSQLEKDTKEITDETKKHLVEKANESLLQKEEGLKADDVPAILAEVSGDEKHESDVQEVVELASEIKATQKEQSEIGDKCVTKIAEVEEIKSFQEEENILVSGDENNGDEMSEATPYIIEDQSTRVSGDDIDYKDRNEILGETDKEVKSSQDEQGSRVSGDENVDKGDEEISETTEILANSEENQSSHEERGSAVSVDDKDREEISETSEILANPDENQSSPEEKGGSVSVDGKDVEEISEATAKKSPQAEQSIVVPVDDNAGKDVEEISETTEILVNPEENQSSPVSVDDKDVEEISEETANKSAQAEQNTVVSVDDIAGKDVEEISGTTEILVNPEENQSSQDEVLAAPEENKPSQEEQSSVVSVDETDVEEIPDTEQVVERLTSLEREKTDNKSNSFNDPENTEKITEDLADSSVRALTAEPDISETLMEDIQSSKLLEEIEDVLNKSDEIKLKHLENRDHDSESIRTLTEENESEKLTQDSNLDYQPSEGDTESDKKESEDLENKSVAENEQETGDSNRDELVGDTVTSTDLSSVMDENVTAPQCSKKFTEIVTSTGTPKRRSRRTSMLAETTSDDTKENIDVSLQSVAKKLMDGEKEAPLTPRRGSRRKSSSMESEAELRPLPTFTPRRSARRASMSLETSHASTPTGKKTRRASLSAVSEAPLTPKRITRRRSSISLDTEEAVKVVQASTKPSGEAEGVPEINEDMGAIIEEEDEDVERVADEPETLITHITNVVLMEEKEAMDIISEGDDVKVVIEENLGEIVSDPSPATAAPIDFEENSEMLSEAITTSVHDLTQGDDGVETVHDLTQDEEEDENVMAVVSESVQDLTQDKKSMSQPINVSVQYISQEAEESICKVIGDSVQDLTQDEENINASSAAVQDLTLDEANVEQDLSGDEQYIAAVQDLSQGVANIDEEELKNVAVQDLTENNESASKFITESVQDLTQDEESICELVSEDLTNDEVDKDKTVGDVVEEDMQTLFVSDDESIYEVNTNEGTQTPKGKKFVSIAANSPKTPSMTGVRELLTTPKPEQSTPKFRGLRHLVRTPKSKLAETEDEEAEKLQNMCELVNTPKTTDSELNAAENVNFEDTNSKFKGVKELLKTPKSCSTPRLRGLRELTQTPKQPSSPALGGIKELLDTPHNQEQQTESEDKDGTPPVSPSKAVEKDEELVNAATPRFKGMRELMQTPKLIGTPALSGVKELLATPVQEKETKDSEINEKVDTTPTASSKEVRVDLRVDPKPSAATPRFKGMRELMQTPKVIDTPTLSGVKDLVATPVQEKYSEVIEIDEDVDSKDLRGVKELLKTPKSSAATPRFKGMRELMQTPKSSSTPILVGVKDLLVSPILQEQQTDGDDVVIYKLETDGPTTSSKDPQNELRRTKELLKTPKGCSTPRFRGMRELMQTPKVTSTPVLSGLKELMDTPKQKSEKDDDFDKFLKTPTAKKITLPTLPSSAIIEKNEDSVEMIHSTEYDLNDSHGDGSTHLQELFKTPVASRFVERITASFYGEEGEESNKSIQENTDTKTPLRTVLQSKSLALKTPQLQSPFSAAEVLSDLSKTDVEEWVEQMDPLQQTINLDDEDDIEEVKETTNLDNSLIIKDDTHNESLSLVSETDSKDYLADKSVNVANTSEAMINLSLLGSSSTSKDPLGGGTASKLKPQGKRPLTPIDTADISGINLLDETGESALDESLVVSDDDEDVNLTLNQSGQTQEEVSSKLSGEDDDNGLRESLLLSGSDEPEKDANGKSPDKPVSSNEISNTESKSTDTEMSLINDRQTCIASENEDIENDTSHALEDASSAKTEEVLSEAVEGKDDHNAEKASENETSYASDEASSIKIENEATEVDVNDCLIAEKTAESDASLALDTTSAENEAEAEKELEQEKETEYSDIEKEEIESEPSTALDISSSKTNDEKEREADNVQEVVISGLEKAHNSECEDIFLNDSLDETSAQDNMNTKTQTPVKSAIKQNDKPDNEVIELTSDESNDCKVIDNDAAEEMSKEDTRNMSMHECEDIFMDDSSVSEVSVSQKESDEGVATVTVESSSDENSKLTEAHEEENNQDSSTSSNRGETNATSVDIQETTTITSNSSQETIEDKDNKNRLPIEESLAESAIVPEENATIKPEVSDAAGKHQNADIISIDDSDSCEEISQPATETVEVVDVDQMLQVPSDGTEEKKLQTTSHEIASGEQENVNEVQCLDDIETSTSTEIEEPLAVDSMSAITSEEVSVVGNATKPEEEPLTSVTIGAEQLTSMEEEIAILEDESKIVSTDTSANAEDNPSETTSKSQQNDIDLESPEFDSKEDSESQTVPAEKKVKPVVADEFSHVTPEPENIESSDNVESSNLEVTALNEVSKEEPTTNVEKSKPMVEESVSNTTTTEETTQMSPLATEVAEVQTTEIVEEVSSTAAAASNSVDTPALNNNLNVSAQNLEISTKASESQSEECESESHKYMADVQAEEKDNISEIQTESQTEHDQTELPVTKSSSETIVEPTQTDEITLESKVNKQTTPSEVTSSCSISETVKTYDIEVKITDTPEYVEETPEHHGKVSKRTRIRKASQTSVGSSNDKTSELPKTRRVRNISQTEQGVGKTEVTTAAELQDIAESGEQHVVTMDNEIVPEDSEVCQDPTTGQEQQCQAPENDIQEVMLKKSEVTPEAVEPKGSNKAVGNTSDDNVSNDITSENYVDEKEEQNKNVIPEESLPMQAPTMEEDTETAMVTQDMEVQPQDIEETAETTHKRLRRKTSQDSVHGDDTNNKKVRRVGRRKLSQDDNKIDDSKETSTTSSSVSKPVGEKVYESEETAKQSQQLAARRNRRKASVDSVHSDDECTTLTRKGGRRKPDIIKDDGAALEQIVETEETPVEDQKASNVQDELVVKVPENVQASDIGTAEADTQLKESTHEAEAPSEVEKHHHQDIKVIKGRVNKRVHRKTSQQSTSDAVPAEEIHLEKIEESEEKPIEEIESTEPTLNKETDVSEATPKETDEQHPGTEVARGRINRRVRRKVSQESAVETVKSHSASVKEAELNKIEEREVQPRDEIQNSEHAGVHVSDISKVPTEVEVQHPDTEVVKVRGNKRGRRKASQEDDCTLEAAKPHSSSAKETDVPKIEEIDEKHISESSDLHESCVPLNIESDVLEAAKENEDLQHDTEMKGRVNKRVQRKATEQSTHEAVIPQVTAVIEESEAELKDVVPETSVPSNKESELFEVPKESVEQHQDTEVKGRVNKRTRRKDSQDEEGSSTSTSHARKCSRRRGVQLTEDEQHHSLDVVDENEEIQATPPVEDAQNAPIKASDVEEVHSADATNEHTKDSEDASEPVNKRGRHKASHVVVHEEEGSSSTRPVKRGGRRKAEIVALEATEVPTSSEMSTDQLKTDNISDVNESEQKLVEQNELLPHDDNTANEPVPKHNRRKANKDSAHDDAIHNEHTRRGGRRVGQLTTNDGATTSTSQPLQDKGPEDNKSDIKQTEQQVSEPVIVRSRRKASQDISHDVDKDVKHTRRVRQLSTKDDEANYADSSPAVLSTVKEDSDQTHLKDVVVIHDDDDDGDDQQEPSKKPTEPETTVADDEADKCVNQVTSLEKEDEKGDEHIVISEEENTDDKPLEEQQNDKSRKTTRRRGAAIQKQPPLVRSRRGRKAHDVDEDPVHQTEKDTQLKPDAESENKSEDLEHQTSSEKTKTTRGAARNIRKKHEDEHHEDGHDHEETKAGTTRGSARIVVKNHDDHHEDEHDHEETKAGTTRGSARNVRKKHDDDHDHQEDEHVHEEPKVVGRRKAPASRKRAPTRKKDSHEEDHEVHEVDTSEVEIPADVNTTEETIKARGGRKKRDEHNEVPVAVIEELPEQATAASHSADTKKKSRKRKESHTEHEEQPPAKVISPETPQRVLTSNDESHQTPESERRARNVPQRRAAIIYHNYDETSDSEKPEKKKKKTDSPRKSLEPTNPVNEHAIKPAAESLVDVSPTLLTPSTTARGRTRKPTARVQKFLEEERAKAESPRKRGGLADASVADTPTKSQPVKRGGKSVLTDTTQSAGTPQTSKRARGKVVTESAEDHEQPPADSHNIVESIVPEHTTPPPATTTSRGRKGGRKAKANAHTGHDDTTDEPAAKKSPQQLSAEKADVVTETIPLNIEDATPTRTTGRRNAAAAAKARIEEDALAAADDHPKKSRARRAPAKVAVSSVKSASTVDAPEVLPAAEEVHAQEEPKTATKRAPRKAAATTDSPAVPAKRSRKAKAATAETDGLEVDEPKTSRAAARGRKNVHFAPADQKTATSDTTPSVEPPPTEVPQAVEEPPAATTKRATRVRRK